jgi:hypothetical protein
MQGALSSAAGFFRFVREVLTVVILFALIGYSVIVSHSKEGRNPDDSDGQKYSQEKTPFRKDDKCPNCGGPAANQEIYVPLIDLPEAKSSEIVFNSRSPHAISVTPTFYRLDGSVVIADPVTVESAEIRYVDIRQLLPNKYKHERNWGGLTLSYFGFNREMWSQVRFLGLNGGKSVDEFFTVKQESLSDQYEAVWWLPDNSESIIALGNITGSHTSATVSYSDETQTVNLAPHATKLIHHKRDKQGVESVVIKVTGAAGSIVPTGLIAGKDATFNSVIRLYSPKLAKQANLFANGFHVDGVVPHMLVKNTTASSIAVVPRFIPLGGLAAKPFVSSQVVLAPNEAREVDLASLLRAAKRKADLDVVSVEVMNPAQAGSIIGAIYSINSETGVNYDVPLRDSGLVRTMTGSYPWKVADDFTTVVYITNISDQKAEFLGEINYHGGRILVDPRSLQPGETAVFDMEKIRAEQIPDKAGRAVPREISQGQFKWSVRGVTNGKLLLIGRAEMVSRSQNISTSYSCNDPCPPFIQGSLDPFLPPIIILSQTGGSSAWASAYYGNGYVSGPYSSSAEWIPDAAMVSLDPSTAHTTSATGESTGGVCVFADMGREESYGWDGLNCYDNNNQYVVGDNTCTQVLDVHIKMGSENITNATKTVIVGQQIALSVEVVGSQDTASNIQWSVPGTRVGGYTASGSSGTVDSSPNMQSNPLTVYWVDAGDNREVTLGCRIGTTQSNKHATFNVKRPTASITTTTGSVSLDSNFIVFGLHFGSPTGTSGISFSRSITMPSGFTGGDTQWVQLIDSITRTFTPNGGSIKTLSGSGVLDSTYPYATGASTGDSPGQGVDSCNDSAVSANDSFSMWLMFKPSGTGSIFVPLRKVSWSWSGSGTRTGTCSWTLSTSNHSTNPTDADSTDFPSWSSNVNSLTFH